MAVVIKPTITLTSNASSATTDPGPMSIALSLSATDSLAVTEVQSKIESLTTTHEVLWAHGSFSDGTEATGTDGGFVYFKNIHATLNVLLGHGGTAALEADNDGLRIMTLQPGEFAWVPWDFTTDWIAEASGTAANALETWVFTRTSSGA
tara:strand:- start:58 stop:507 length:450 start_codon:yes stop_codon:yes gene_type:complete